MNKRLGVAGYHASSNKCLCKLMIANSKMRVSIPGQTSLPGKSANSLLSLWEGAWRIAADAIGMVGSSTETAGQSWRSKCCRSSRIRNSVHPLGTQQATSRACLSWLPLATPSLQGQFRQMQSNKVRANCSAPAVRDQHQYVWRY